PCAKCAGGGTATATTMSATGMPDNIAGMLCYLLIPAIVFLVMEPYNRNRFIRFHSFQAIFLAIACMVLGVAIGIFAQIPFLGWAAAFLLAPLIGLAEFILWVLLLLKAYQGQMFKLPVIGDMAEKQANAG